MFRKMLILIILLGNLLNATVPTDKSVTKLYIATFNRAPDRAGLDYWVKKSGLELENIARSFFDQEETKKLYPPGFSRADFIEAVYANLFQRKSDADGFDYWYDELSAKNIDNSVFILALIDGAKDNDKKLLQNKTEVGLSFIEAGRNDAIEAHLIMLDITADKNSVTSTLYAYGLSNIKPKPQQPKPEVSKDKNTTNKNNCYTSKYNHR